MRETVGCGVCGTNTLQINGLEGVYTLVLLDGVPLLGGLASAYALDGIPLGMIQQVEVIQGPASARFGSQAVGGVINIVLAPIRPGHGRASATLDTHGRLLVSANSAFGSDESPWQIGADVQRFTTRIDDNGDGYTDAPTLERGVLTVRKQHQGNQRRWRTTLRTLAEERFGGALDFREADRGLETRYGERIDLLRIEGVAGSSPLDGEGWRFQGGGGLPPPAVHLRHHELQCGRVDNQCRRFSQRLVRGRTRTLHQRREPAVGPLHRRDPGRL